MTHLRLIADNPVNLVDLLAAEHAQRETGRLPFRHRAGRASTEPQSSFRLGLSATIAIACVALSLLTIAYFAWEFTR
jgi:hypothetical protein